MPRPYALAAALRVLAPGLVRRVLGGGAAAVDDDDDRRRHGRAPERHGGARLTGLGRGSAEPESLARALVTGATGFIGGRLAGSLLATRRARCAASCAIAREPASFEQRGCEVHQRRRRRRRRASRAGARVDVAYFLVHAMAGGRGLRASESTTERVNFARMAAAGGRRAGSSISAASATSSVSKHLRSRHETALTLASEGPPLTYFRAAMVVGAESESYRTLRYLVKRLPVMIAPELAEDGDPADRRSMTWSSTSRRAPEVPESEGREVQIGGPDVLSYGEMLDRMAIAMGMRPRPKLPGPASSRRGCRRCGWAS